MTVICRNCIPWLATLFFFFLLIFILFSRSFVGSYTLLCLRSSLYTPGILIMSTEPLLLSVFIFDFHQAIRHPSSAVDDRIGLKIRIYKELESGRKITPLLGFSWLKPSLPTFLLLIPLTPEPCWKSGGVVGFSSADVCWNSGRQKQFFTPS